MVRRLLTSPLLSLLLALALAASLLSKSERSRYARAIAFYRNGSTLLIDFDSPLASAQQVSLDPPAPMRARLLTPRRIEIQAELKRFVRYEVRFGDAFADRDGRPVRAEVPLSFTTGVFGLQKPPSTHISYYGRVACALRFNSPVDRQRLNEHLRLVNDMGTAIPFQLDGRGEAWELELSNRPEAGSTLVLERGLLVEERRHTLTWPADLGISEVDVSSKRVSVEFTHVLTEQDLRGFFVLDPEPKNLTVDPGSYRVRLRGDFAPGSLVKLTVKQGIRAVGGLRLARDLKRTLRVPDHEPRVRFVQKGRTLSAAARRELEIGGVNVERVRIEIRSVYESNLVPLALRWRSARRLSAPPVTYTLRIDAKRNERWTRRLELEQPVGVYEITLKRPDSYWGTRRLLQITDLAPVVRSAPEGLVVFLARISTGKPVAGAEVVGYGEKNQVCARGRTDRDGIFVARGLEQKPFVVTAALDGDLAYVSLKRHGLAHEGRDVEGRPPARGMEAFVYTDRGVVRPGATCRVGVLLRPPTAGLPLSLRLLGPDGRVVRRFSRPASRFGVATLDLPFAHDAPTGAYAVEAYVPGSDRAAGRTSFRIEAFVPDRIEPSIALPEGDLEAGATIEAGLSARLLAGLPAAGLRAHLKVRYAPRQFEQRDGFVFGDPHSAPAPFERDLGERKLDEAGTARLSVTLPRGRSLLASFTLEVIDVSGRAAFARTSRRILVAGPRLGIAPPGREFELRVVGGGGREVPEVEAVLDRLCWRGAYVNHVWRAQLVATSVARTVVKDGKALFVDPGDGRYRVRVTAKGCAPAAIRFDRWDGRTHIDDQPAGAPRLALKAVTGGIRVDAPFAGAGLLTVEGPGVLSARRVEIRSGGQLVPVELPTTDAPNLYATLTLVRGAPPARLLGAVSIPIPRPRLEVSLEAPAQALPESTLAVTVTTSEPSDVVVHLVDEGVLRLTGHPTPDPAGFFGARRRLETELADSYTQLLERMRFESDDPEPGGGGSRSTWAKRLDPTARRTIETLALASRLVRVDKSARVVFELPGYEGRVRLFAVAASESATGSYSRSVSVEEPVSIAIFVPRAVAPGDCFIVPIQCDVSYATQLRGLEQLSASPLKVRALEPGVASVTVLAGGFRRVARFSVRPPYPYTVLHLVRTAKQCDEALPGKWLTRRARIRVGADPCLDLLPALERLVEYPHGCVEQTTSRAFPVLAWSELASSPDGGRPRDTVGEAIGRLLMMQTANGGLASWPGGREVSEFGSVYAAHFLVEARRMGRPVPEDRLDPLLDYIERDAGPYGALVLTLAGRATGPLLERLPAVSVEDKARLAAAFLLRGERARANELLQQTGDPWAAPRRRGGDLSSPVRAAATLLGALAEVAPNDARVAELALRVRRAARLAARNTTQENAAALLALAKLRRSAPLDLSGVLTVAGKRHRIDGGTSVEIGPGQPWRFALRANRPATVVVRMEGIPLDAETGEVMRGLRVRRRVEGPFRQGRVYRVVIEGVAPPGTANLLVTDLLCGGFEVEAARNQKGTLKPDRVEPRDDRVLFFRTREIVGAFSQTYYVRAVTRGRFKLPPVRAELLYDPELFAQSSGGGMIEVVR